MNNYKCFHELIRKQIQSYRLQHSYTQEHMAELLHISARSYFDQEHGKYGFSSITLAYFLLMLSAEEVMSLLGEVRTVLEGRDRNEDF
ncbi:MAG: hypothetical protein Q4D60_06210 [Eubacteriales bacterium]|nr:hypothetical protein [Eubacteriales bacterium]